MFGLANPYVLIGGALLFIAAVGGSYVKGRVDAGKKYEKQIGALATANKTFADQQQILRDKGIADAAKLEQAKADMLLIGEEVQTGLSRVRNRPVAPGCEGLLADQRAFYQEELAAKKPRRVP